MVFFYFNNREFCPVLKNLKFDFYLKQTLRGQFVHWIGAQFGVCMILDSSDKSSNMLKFSWNDQRK